MGLEDFELLKRYFVRRADGSVRGRFVHMPLDASELQMQRARAVVDIMPEDCDRAATEDEVRAYSARCIAQGHEWF